VAISFAIGSVNSNVVRSLATAGHHKNPTKAPAFARLLNFFQRPPPCCLDF